jgi:predicted esterase
MNLETPNAAPGRRKPAILCLHGGGTNTTIFKVQTIRIQRALNSHFDFVFLNAPFESGAGPGVHPVFEGCDPYFRWVLDSSLVEMAEKTRDVIRDCFEDQRLKDGRGFVGVLGFSQGARVAAGLLLQQQLKISEVGEGLCFGVFMNGTRPPLTYGLSEQEQVQRIALPSLSVLGKADPWREDGRKLFSDHCDEKQAVLLEFDVGHRLPLLEEDTKQLAAEILRMHHETSGNTFAQLNGTA